MRMTKEVYKAAVGIRGDCLYCPLPLYIDSYWNCLVDCHHCWLRRLNRTWGMDLRPANPELVRKQLETGLKNTKPKSSLAWALFHKKTIRLGNKTDPYQPAEREYRVSRRIQGHLVDLNWSYVIQTRFLTNLVDDEDVMGKAHEAGLLTVMPFISPGAELDQLVLERGRTPLIEDRLRLIRRWVGFGWNVGVNGEPFIPGYHTVDQFRDILRRLKAVGVRSYNTYNLHLNDHVAKRFVEIGLNLERIWHMNQDKQWHPIQQELCRVAEEEGVILGCPDFVNVPEKWKARSNTCCGITVPNPSRFNTHWWRKKLQAGESPEDVLKITWEGIGDQQLGRKVVMGESCEFYTMGDSIPSEGFGL